jgi:hypothetical protein
MVGAPLMIVKDRHRQFSLRFFSPPLIFNCCEGIPQTTLLFYGAAERNFLTARSSSMRDDWACPAPFS